MITELRRYVPAEGKAAALLERLLHDVAPLLRHRGFRLGPIWVSPDDGDIWYSVEWNDRNDMASSWSAFLASPEWLAIKATSEANGPLLEKLERRILTKVWTA